VDRETWRPLSILSQLPLGLGREEAALRLLPFNSFSVASDLAGSLATEYAQPAFNSFSVASDLTIPFNVRFAFLLSILSQLPHIILKGDLF